MTPIFFKTQAGFRKWLEKNHDKASELLVGFYKVGSGKASMSWSQSVDQALCFGWIDCIRRRIDEERYSIRFTPRKPRSIWSTINIKKAEQLIGSGQMELAGLSAFKKRSEIKSGIYSYENAPAKLSREFERTFRTNKKAWAFFSAQAPSYQKAVIHWITGAKREKTRISRLDQTIVASEKQLRLL